MITAQGGITKWQRVRISSDGGMDAGKPAIATVSYTHLDVYKRQDLVEAAQNAMREMISRMQHQICDSPIIADNMRQLVQALETTTGKKQYGYLKKPLKQLVDTIVDALAELPEVSECYEVWNQIHEELNECYGHP